LTLLYACVATTDQRAARLSLALAVVGQPDPAGLRRRNFTEFTRTATFHRR
jgi:hypothetical protein